MKPSASRLSSGVEFSWIAPRAQWWLVTTRPSGETKLAVQPPSDTTAFIGGFVRSASAAGSLVAGGAQLVGDGRQLRRQPHAFATRIVGVRRRGGHADGRCKGGGGDRGLQIGRAHV